VTTAVGTTAVFSVVANSTVNPSYEWQRQFPGASSWVRVTDGSFGGGSTAAGSGSPTLTITNAQTSSSGTLRVVVSNGTAPDATSVEATLTVTPPPTVQAIAAGAAHTCALRTDGTVSCVGADGSGQLGNGNVGVPGVPAVLPGLRGVTALAAGYEHTCVVKALGEVACWGSDNFGQLGDSGALQGVSQAAPYTVPGLSGVVAVAAGGDFTCALRSSGGVICWGGSGFGSLATSGGPVNVPGITDAVALTAGYFHACVVRSSGTLACWGGNAYGQLGDGTLVDRASPTTVPGLDNVVAVAGGQQHTCAAKSDGTVRCWGSNRLGQFGTGVILANPVPTPTVVPGLTDVTALAAGAFFNCALRPGNQPVPLHGNLSCWGDNTAGQLGSVTAGFSPNELLLAPLKGLATGNAHSCVVTADGAALCWGLNYYGELGDGTTVNRPVPTPVSF